MNRLNTWLAAAALSLALPLAASEPPVTHHRTAKIEGVDVFYREAGPRDAPVVVLLHGFPSSSHMYRNLIPALAEHYRGRVATWLTKPKGEAA